MFLNKMFIGDCPLFLNKTVFRRLSNAFEIKRVIRDCPLFLNKIVYRILSNAFEIMRVIGDCPLFLNKTKYCIGIRRPVVRTQKSVAHKCITHSTGV